MLLIAPFWVSYMMRMLAWIDLLQQRVRRTARCRPSLGLPGQTDWLGGKSVTVVMGLVYGYIPYLILVLYAFLDRISLRACWRLPGISDSASGGPSACHCSVEQAGDHRRDVHHRAADARRLFHEPADVGAPGNVTSSNAVEGQLDSPGETGQGAVLALDAVLVALLIPMVDYVASTALASREYKLPHRQARLASL